MPNLKEQITNFQTILDLVKDSLNNGFSIDKKTLAIFIGAIIYVIVPIDLIPDFVVGVGWLDDIAVIAWVANNFNTIINTYQASKDLIDHHINQTIEDKIILWIEKINTQINKQYKSLGVQLTLELSVLGSVIGYHYYNPTTSIKNIIYVYIGIRALIALLKVTYGFFSLLNSIEFFKISQLVPYWKSTKNIHKAIILDMKNFYDYHYQLLTTKSFRIVHKIGNVVKLTPDNEEIFNRIFDRLKENIPKFLKKELLIFLIFFILYTSIMSIVRHISLDYLLD